MKCRADQILLDCWAPRTAEHLNFAFRSMRVAQLLLDILLMESVVPVQGVLQMVDALADRGAEEEALCCVCGGGDSSKEAGNEIVFCERCDMAVHQKCYRVDTIPAGRFTSMSSPKQTLRSSPIWPPDAKTHKMELTAWQCRNRLLWCYLLPTRPLFLSNPVFPCISDF